MMHQAQEALAHKMGTLPKDRSLTDDVLKEYFAAFEAPLPQDTIAALSQLFKMDCQLTSLADDRDNGPLNTTSSTLPQTPTPAPGALVVAA